MFVQGYSTIAFSGITVSTSTSLLEGGFLYVYDTSTTNLIGITFSGTTIFNTISSTNGNGGTFYVNSPKLTLTIGGKSTFSSSLASLKGGLMYIQNALAVSLTSST